MPSSVGPNTFGEENLVFGYDLGDVANSYKGQPTVNLAAAGGLIGMSGITLTDLGIEDGWRKYGMSGTFTGGTYPYIMRISSYTFTGGVIYSSRCTVKTNVKYKFNYFGANGLSYVNEPMSNGGSLSSIQNSDGSYTIARIGFAYTNTTSQPGYLWTNPINNTTFNSTTDFVWIKELQVEQKPFPTQFVNGTRSVTQGLIDIKGTSTIDLTNVSFDSNAQMTFDGTNDTISVNSYPAIELVDNVSIEYVYMRLSTDPVLDVIANKYHSTGWELFCQTGNTFALAGRNGDGTYYVTSNAAYTIQNNQYYHLVAMKEGLSWRLYVNGELYAYLTATTVGTWSNTGILQLGGEGNGYYPNMQLPVFKIYNRILTAQEVRSNYNAIKSRFSI